jgi:hypothetical protein
MNNEDFGIGKAVELLLQGKKIGIRGEDEWIEFLYLVEGSTFAVTRKPLLGIYPEGTTVSYRTHIDVKYINGEIAPWNPTCDDILREDYFEVE